MLISAHSFAEYVAMCDLTEADLAGRVLDCQLATERVATEVRATARYEFQHGGNQMLVLERTPPRGTDDTPDRPAAGPA